MNRFLVVLFSFVCLAPAQAQGTLNWGNRIPGVLLAPFYGVDPADPTASRAGNTPLGLPAGTQTYRGPLLAGGSFSAQLYYGPAAASADSLLPLAAAPATFGTGANAGFYDGGPSALPGIGAGQIFAAQVRVWDNRSGGVATWEAALADPTVPRGASTVLAVDLSGFLPGQTPYLRGLESFQLHTVPEPSALVLGLSATGILYGWPRRTTRSR